MSKHTPGPWHVVCHTSEDGRIGPGDDWTVYGRNTTHAIAFEGGHNPHAEADARLIAAAPDLLEALQALLELDVYADCPGLVSVGGYDNSDAEEVIKARAAIQRAVGADHA
jgi:hypothetical protein